MKRIIIWIALLGLVIFLGIAALTFSSIYKSVERITTNAKSEFQGDAVHALIDLVNSDKYGFEEKNSAIWALGQLADPSALPFLEKINPEIEDSIPFDRTSGLSKKEIERAIKWCTKGNSTSWMYRKIR